LHKKNKREGKPSTKENLERGKSHGTQPAFMSHNSQAIFIFIDCQHNAACVYHQLCIHLLSRVSLLWNITFEPIGHKTRYAIERSWLGHFMKRKTINSCDKSAISNR